MAEISAPTFPRELMGLGYLHLIFLLLFACLLCNELRSLSLLYSVYTGLMMHPIGPWYKMAISAATRAS